MMRKKQMYKIAYLTCTGSIPSRSADAVCVMNMCCALASRGAAVDLIIPKGQALSLDELGCAGTLWDFYGLPPNFSIRYLYDPFKRCPAAIRRNGYAFLALCGAVLAGARMINARQIELALTAARFGTPFVFECHNFLKPSGSRLFPRFIETMNRPRCRGRVVTTTQAGRKSFAEAGVPESRIAVLPNGADPQRHEGLPARQDLRERLGLPVAGAIVCFSGSLYPGRGIEHIMYCAERFRDIFFLIIGGSPDDMEPYRAMAVRNSLRNMRFTGHIPATALPGWLAAADIVLMPYTSASAHAYMSPMKMFDYLAAGKTIIAADFPVVREVLRHDHNAVLVEADSAECLARGLQWALDNPGAAAAMAARARSDAAQYAWQLRAERYLSFVRAARS